MIEDLKNSILSQLQQRLTDPFLGLITVSIALYNWQPLLILLLDSRGIVERIGYIEARFFPDYWSVLSALAHPIGFSLCWYAAWPWLRRMASWYYTKQSLRLAKTQADLAAKPQYEPKLARLENDQRKLTALETAYTQLYKKTAGVREIGSLVVTLCEVAQRGSWVHWDGASARLATAAPGAPIWANGLVIERWDSGFVVIQLAGSVEWRVFEQTALKPSETTTYFLGDESGQMTPSRPRSHKRNQRVATANVEGGSVIVSLDLQME